MELTADQEAKIKQLEAANKMVALLEKLTAQKPMDLKSAEKLLADIKAELSSLKDRKAPDVNVNVDLANFTAPLQKALEASSAALTNAIAGIKPTANVAAPKVTVKAPDVNIDLKAVISAIKANKPVIPDFPETLIPDLSAIHVNGQSLEPFHTPVDFIERGIVDVVEGVEGKRIRVVSGLLMANGYTDITFKSGRTDISGSLSLRPYAGFALPKNEYGWLETLEGDSLSIQSSAYTTVGGMLTFVIV